MIKTDHKRIKNDTTCELPEDFVNFLPMVEIFHTIQGEGRYQGHPVIFVRVSGCNRVCSFCDTQFHKVGDVWPIEKVIEDIKAYPCKTVVFTGGEPTLYPEAICEIKKRLGFGYTFHLESNGDLAIFRNGTYILKGKDKEYDLLEIFDYLGFSPKGFNVAKKFATNPIPGKMEIKVVTDLEKEGVDMVPYATSLMPLTSFVDLEKDMEVRRRVWEYCTQKGLIFSSRLHTILWGSKQKV